MKKVLYIYTILSLVLAGVAYATVYHYPAPSLSAMDQLFGTTTGATKCYFNNKGSCDSTAGAGDMVGPSASSDSELPLFSSTTGKVLKRSNTQTGLVYVTSGVVSVKSIGTDVQAAGNYLITSGAVTTGNLTKKGTGNTLVDAGTPGDIVTHNASEFAVAGNYLINSGTITAGKITKRGAGATTITDAAAADVVSLWTTCTSGYLKYDGTCADPSGTGANANGYYLVNRSTNAPTNAINLGGFSTGYLYETVTSGVATFTTSTAPLTSITDSTSTTSSTVAASATAVKAAYDHAGAGGADANGYYLVNRSTNAPTNAENLGLLTSGYSYITVTSGVASTSTSNPVSDTAYNATSWDGVTTIAPSKNAVRDYLESFFSTGADGTYGLGLKNNTSTMATPAGFDGVYGFVGGNPSFRYGAGTVYTLAKTGDIPAASTTNPSMDGSVSYGTGTTYARADHIHPVDTSRAAIGANTFTGDQTISTHNIVTDTSTGSKIGTATNQKLAFFNSTPIVQPTGDVKTALGNLGLVGTPTIAADTVASGGTGTTPTADSNDTKVSTTTYVDSQFIITGSGMTAGRAYYLAASTGTLTAADATSITTLPTPAVCVATSATVCRRIGKWTTTGLTAGSVYYVPVATGGGALTTTPPTGSGNQQQAIGQASSSTVLEIWPNRLVIGF